MDNLELEYVYTDKDEIVVKSYNNYFNGLTRNYMIVYRFKYNFDDDNLILFDEKIYNDDNEEKISDDLENLIKDKCYLKLNSNYTMVKNQVMQDLRESEIEKENFMYPDKCYEDEYKTYILNGNNKVYVSFSYHFGWGKNWNSFKWSLDLTSVDCTFLDDKMLSQILYITMMLNEYGKEYFEKTK